MRVVRQITFEAHNDADAVAMARERLGRDAVILSTQMVKRGGFLGLFRRKVLLVTAGLLEEEPTRSAAPPEETKERIMAFQRLLEVKHAVRDAVGQGREPQESSREHAQGVRLELSPQGKAMAAAAAVAPVPAPAPLLSPPPVSKAVPPTAVDEELKRQVDEIHRTLANVLHRLEEDRREPVPRAPSPQEELVRHLEASDVSAHHAREVAEACGTSGLEALVPLLVSRISVCGADVHDALGGKRVMFIGPTGVGKTTTIAKLAAIYSLWERKNVLMLTADTYRIAAVEQLRTYARILGVPFEVVFSPQEIPEALAKHGDPDLVLLDTAGRSQRDAKRLEELQALYRMFRPDAVHLVVSANMKYRDMLDVVDRMGVVPVSCLLFTKLDETLTYGNMLNAVLDFQKPLSFVTTGQDVPNDIEVAGAERIARLVAGEDGMGR